VECQVTSTSFQSQDALGSTPARVTVQVPPSTITIQGQGDRMVLRMVEDKLENITCMTSHSNPAPTISWELGDKVLDSTQKMISNTSESVLAQSFPRSSSGLELRCVVMHGAYPTGRRVVTAILDILYKPTVSIQREDSPVLEDGVGSSTLTCTSQANPPATVSWQKVGDKVTKQDTLHMNPIKREQAGVYICQAENSVGRSEPEETEVDVLYAPHSVSTDPAGVVEVMVHNHTVLTCHAEANPAPKYQWVQVLSRSYTPRLVLEDVSYSDQGEYMCVATNRIGGQRREGRSEKVRVEVVMSPPQVVKQVGEVVGIHGTDVRIEAEFCSDPVPLHTAWKWGDTVLPTGSEVGGRYQADMVPHPHMEDCYISRLTLTRVGQQDNKEYTLTVENQHGKDMVPVLLKIKAPIPIGSTMAAGSLVLVGIFLLSITCVLLRRRNKLCWQDKVTEKEACMDQTTYKGDSKLSLVNENKETISEKVGPPSTKV
jgi:hypothetical protein